MFCSGAHGPNGPKVLAGALSTACRHSRARPARGEVRGHGNRSSSQEVATATTGFSLAGSATEASLSSGAGRPVRAACTAAGNSSQTYGLSSPLMAT